MTTPADLSFIANCLRRDADLVLQTESLIHESRSKIRKQLLNASARVVASRVAVEHSVARTDALVQQSCQQFDRWERQVLPLISAHLSELQSLIQIQEQENCIATKSHPTENADPRSETTIEDWCEDADEEDDIVAEFLVQGRDLLHKDLTDDYPVGQDDVLDQNSPLTFNFPACLVSKFLLSVLELVLQILSDAEFCDDEKRQFLLRNTGLKVTQMFVVCLPVIQWKHVEKDERQAALFHNNCFFAAHFLLTSPQIRDANLDFKHLIPKLQSKGETAVRWWVEKKKGTVADCFQKPEVIQCLIDSHVKGNSLKAFELAVSDSLLLLQKMHQNWSDILPRSVFNHLAADVMAVILDEVMRLVLMLEDITSRAAEAIACAMSSIRKNMSNFLVQPHSGIPELLPNSFQFLELERLMTGSLADVVSRWGGGFGPLSVAFPAEQVRKLIRALFQNNEVRASALNKIREL